MIGLTIDQLVVGQKAELSRVVRDTDIAAFVDAVGDRNPIHSDPGFAARTSFRSPIAPGIWTAGLISGVIGTRLPGPGSIYVSQDLKFLRPVRAGDAITARVEVVELLRERNRVRLRTICVNQRGEEVLSGEAWVLPPKTSVQYAAEAAGGRAMAFWMVQPLAWTAQTIALAGTMWAALASSWGPLATRKPSA